MTRLEQLVAGAEVEWRTLGEVVQIKHGKDYKHLPAGRYPVYGSGGVMAHVDGFVYDKPTVLIPRKGSLQNLFYVDSPFWNVDTIYYTVINPCHVVPKYLYYYLKNQHLERLNIAGAVPSLTQSALVSIPIPLPSLAVQAEIVQILDAFTASEAELESALTRELSARRKQYEYYREQLLSFGEDEVEWKTLGEIGSICMCKRVLKRETASAGDVPFYKIGTFGREADAYISQKRYEELAQKSPPPRKGEVLLSVAGTIGRAVIHDGAPAYFQDSNIVWISHDESQVLNRFLYHYYQVARWTVDDSGIIARLYNWRLAAYPVPIPPLARQAEIADVLDRLHALSHSLMDGLPAELAARRKQYEHYREQLLSFPGANSTHK